MALQVSDSVVNFEPKLEADTNRELIGQKWSQNRSASDSSSISSPDSSSGYNSQSSVDDLTESPAEELSDDSDEQIRRIDGVRLTNDSGQQSDNDLHGWNVADPFDPNNPYRDEPLNYPPDHYFYIPGHPCQVLYAPVRSLPKRLCLKRVSLSPEVKAKVSKRTGLAKRSPQFYGPDSCSDESSDSD